jgi:hypothetical protein
MTDPNVAAVRAAVAAGAALAESFMVCTAKWFDPNGENPTQAIFETICRVKAPRPSSFDAGNSAEWATKRYLTISIPNRTAGLNNTQVPNVIRKGLVVQVDGADDPTINHVSFTVQSQIGATFAATREISVATETNETPRGA